MTDIITAIILGVVEGLTEMLPVSSTGHLILVNEWFSFGEPFTALFDIVIQFGAILAVLTYFWSLMSPFQPKEKLPAVFQLWILLVIGIFPILILGYLIGGDVLSQLFTPQTVAIALIINGILLTVIDRFAPPVSTTSLSALSKGQVTFIGLTHILGLIPVMSRSASATIAAMSLGVDRTTASQFSMLMAIPTLFVASAYSLLHFEGVIATREWALLAIGLLVSWAVCYLTVKWFFRFIQKFGLQYFGYYRIVLGVVVLLFLG